MLGHASKSLSHRMSQNTCKRNLMQLNKPSKRSRAAIYKLLLKHTWVVAVDLEFDISSFVEPSHCFYERTIGITVAYKNLHPSTFECKAFVYTMTLHVPGTFYSSTGKINSSK